MLRQFARYFISGCLALAVHLAVLALLVELFAIPAIAATAAGFVVGLVVNYAIQHAWVFRVDGEHERFFVRYVLITIVTFILNMVLFWVGHQVIGLWYPVAQIAATGIVFVLNFGINRLYTFSPRP